MADDSRSAKPEALWMDSIHLDQAHPLIGITLADLGPGKWLRDHRGELLGGAHRPMVDALAFLSSSWRSLSKNLDQGRHDCYKAWPERERSRRRRGQDKHLHYSRGVTVEEMRQASIAVMKLVPTRPVAGPKGRDGIGRDQVADDEVAAPIGPWPAGRVALSSVQPDLGRSGRIANELLSSEIWWQVSRGARRVAT